MMNKGVINIQIDQGYIKQVVKDTINTALERDLSGVTWSMEEFRNECCGGKASRWVTYYIFTDFKDEIDYRNGGWLIPAKGRGQKHIIFAKQAKEWIERNKYRIDWTAKLPE